jgi:alkanesulfonate monooxygenase SsuD/methylene tetrahydromethanopterin reductase-like flavin-dependent oxidoreductase (luciferase family)
MLWMYCAATSAEAEEGWEFFRQNIRESRRHHFDWNNQSFEGIPGYEEYHERFTKLDDENVDYVEGSINNQRNTQPIGTPDEIIDRMKDVQRSIGAGMFVLMVFYGEMPKEKAERSLRLFAEKVLPEIHAIDVSAVAI